MGFFSKIGEGLKKTRDSLLQSMNTMLHSFTRIDEELFEELEEILIMGDVGAATAGRICEELRRKVKERGKPIPGGSRGCWRKPWPNCCGADRSWSCTPNRQ